MMKLNGVSYKHDAKGPRNKTCDMIRDEIRCVPGETSFFLRVSEESVSDLSDLTLSEATFIMENAIASVLVNEEVYQHLTDIMKADKDELSKQYDKIIVRYKMIECPKENIENIGKCFAVFIRTVIFRSQCSVMERMQKEQSICVYLVMIII